MRDSTQIVGPLLVVSPDVENVVISASRNQFACAITPFLEMYGFGCHEVVPLSSARDALMSKKWAAAIILNQEHWERVEELLDLLNQQTGACLIEGPITSELAEAIGVEIQTFKDEQALKRVELTASSLSEQITTCLSGYINASDVSLEPICSTVGWVEADQSGKKYVREEAIDSPFHSFISQYQSFVGGDESFLSLKGDGAALLVRKGRLIVAGAPVLNLVCQRLGVADLPAPWRRAVGERNGENLDLLILLSLAQAAAMHGAPLVSIDPWPDGMAYPVTVRYDVDRPVSEADWARLLNWQEHFGVRPTWYYLAKTIDPNRIVETASRGHEIALHYTNLERRGGVERDALRGVAAAAGTHIIGASCHGGNYHGGRDLDWLERSGFEYAEVLPRCAFFPFRVVAAPTAGEPASAGGIWAVARHLSVDKKMSPPEADFGYGVRTRPTRQRLGAHTVIMNHPDINFKAMTKAVEAYHSPSVEYWTQGETVEWWRKTHQVGAVNIQYTEDSNGYQISASCRTVRNPVLRIWADVDVLDGARKDETFGPVHTLAPASSTHVLFQVKPYAA